MEIPSYETALTAASDEMQALLKQRSAIDARIAQLKTTIDALAALMTPPPSDEPASYGEVVGYLGEVAGITNAIRQVLAKSKVPLAPGEIKAELIGGGVDLSEYANAGAVIHNTLHRLVRQGEIMSMQNPGESTYYTLSKDIYRKAMDAISPKGPAPGQSRLMKQLDAERLKKK